MKINRNNYFSKFLVTALKTVTVCAIAYIILYMVDRKNNGK